MRQAKPNWSAYYQKRKVAPPRPLLLDVMARFTADSSVHRRQAIDLGCGAGSDTLALLEQGWHVLAIDQQAEAIEHLHATVPDARRAQLQTLVTPFEGLTLPSADLIYAGYSLPFCRPERFTTVWQQINQAIRPGGRFAGQIFGERDQWASNPKMTFFTEDETRALFTGFVLEHFHEVDEDGKATTGPKHWHYFDIIAQKE